MRRFASLPSVERLRELLHYDADSGVFTWRVSRGPLRRGSPAGWAHKTGYIYIAVDGRSYKAHRLAWLYVHGAEPKGLLDHIDRNPANNAMANLREATEPQSNQNKRTYKNNRTGIKGVGWNIRANKWRARIQAEGRVLHLGFFDTLESAVAARNAAEQRLHINQERGL